MRRRRPSRIDLQDYTDGNSNAAESETTLHVGPSSRCLRRERRKRFKFLIPMKFTEEIIIEKKKTLVLSYTKTRRSTSLSRLASKTGFSGANQRCCYQMGRAIQAINGRRPYAEKKSLGLSRRSNRSPGAQERKVHDLSATLGAVQSKLLL